DHRVHGMLPGPGGGDHGAEGVVPRDRGLAAGGRVDGHAEIREGDLVLLVPGGHAHGDGLPRSETRAAISSGVWPATSCPRIVVPGRARPSNCFAYARAPPPRTTAITAMIASRMKTSRLRPPRRADGPPSAAGS